MKKKYKGYFKKQTNTLNDIRFKKVVLNEWGFTENPRISLWVKLYGKR